jgi:predicted transcriptional regulator
LTGTPPLQGDLQVQVMKALWRLGQGTVEDARGALPAAGRGAYTTIQTVLNRLAERGLVGRERRGKTIVYRPLLSEAEYLSRSIEHTLARASSDARQAALAELIGGLERNELSQIQRKARAIERKRRDP